MQMGKVLMTTIRIFKGINFYSGVIGSTLHLHGPSGKEKIASRLAMYISRIYKTRGRYFCTTVEHDIDGTCDYIFEIERD
jgi:hypothetical protein